MGTGSNKIWCLRASAGLYFHLFWRRGYVLPGNKLLLQSIISIIVLLCVWGGGGGGGGSLSCPFGVNLG